MLLRLWRTAYGFPTAALLLCGYLIYRCNLREECQEIRRMNEAKQQRLMWERKRPSAALCRCFLENLAAAAGRANPCFMAACLYLGGAGSLLWMMIVSPICIFLRFVQLSLLWPQAETEEAGLRRGAQERQERRKRQEVRDKGAETGSGKVFERRERERSGLAGLIESELCTRMHMPSAAWLARLMGLGSSASAVSFLPLYGAALWMRQYTGAPAAAVPAAVAFVLLFFTLRSEQEGKLPEQKKQAPEQKKQVPPASVAQTSVAQPAGAPADVAAQKRFEYPWSACACILYLLLLLLLFLSQLPRMNIVLSAVISDGFQQNSFMGSAVNRGWLTCFAAGVGMACYISGLTEESSSRNYLRLLEQFSEEKSRRAVRGAEATQKEAGTLLQMTFACAAEAAAGLWGAGLGTGLCLVAAEISRTGTPLGSAAEVVQAWSVQEGLPAWLSGGSFALFLLLSFSLSLWNWKRQLQEVGRCKAIWIFCGCAAGALWGFLLPEGPLWAALLLLLLWPQLLCRLIAWICLSDRFRRLWMRWSQP